MVDFEKAVKDRLWWLIIVLSITAFVGSLQGYLQLTRMEFLQVWTLIGIFFIIIILYTGFQRMDAGFRELGAKVDSLRETQYQPPNLTRRPAGSSDAPKSEEEEEIKTTGAGAFAGMIVGGLLGLALGPAGVVAGGIIGAIIGDQLERENLKARRRETL